VGWFDNQIEYRKQNEEELLAESFQKMAQAITGHKIEAISWTPEGADVRDAISQLLKYYNIKEKETPAKYTDLEEQLDYQLSTSGVMYREVELEKGWRKDAMGALIAILTEGEDQKVITILPQNSGGYAYIDPKSGEKVKVNGAAEKKIGKEAFCFYTPLPMRQLKLKDLFKYMVACLTRWDLVSFGLAALAIAVVGLLITKSNQLLFGPVVEYNSNQLLIAVMALMVCTTIGILMFNIIKEILVNRIRTKLNVNVNAATMMRVLSLPASFFKDYSSGELNEYLQYMGSLSSVLVDSILSTGITGVFSLIYIFQIFNFAKSLVVPSIVVTLLSLAIAVIAAKMQMNIGRERVDITAKENGLTYSLITSMQKIRLSGAENRAFAKWANLYSQEAALTYNPPMFLKVSSVITTAVTMIGTIIMYWVSVKTHVSVADYYAFNSAYGYVSASFTALASIAVSIGSIKPILSIIQPLLDAEPELQEGKETVTALSGGIEFSHVSFKYDQDSPLIVDDLSLNISPREYVAIVGKTGCGKSTLVRLLMGFEKPTMGSVLFDHKDIQRLDMCSVRKHIGTVMQDAKIFGGSIYDNIVISDPTLTVDQAWEAAEIAGLADDIRDMPMGMNTYLMEGQGGLSGGQRQRLMIARAVAPKPKILIFDEATSALDNITQKQVSDALDAMKCTRIVIAHRLSTIKHCDRILVFEKGKIIEDGTYDELIAKKGFFADLVERQRVDID